MGNKMIVSLVNWYKNSNALRRIEEFLGVGFMLVVFVAVVLVVICFLPALLVLAVNALASMGGSEFHVDHKLTNYIAIWFCMIVIRLIFPRGKK